MKIAFCHIHKDKNWPILLYLPVHLIARGEHVFFFFHPCTLFAWKQALVQFKAVAFFSLLDSEARQPPLWIPFRCGKCFTEFDGCK